MSTEPSVFIYAYERLLMGQNEKSLSHTLNTLNSMKDIRINVGHIWRYAVTDILHWTPQQALMYLDDQLVEMLCLNKTFSPLRISSRKEDHMPDYAFILQYAFPDEIHWNDNIWALDVFKKCAHIEEYQNSTKKYEYPKGFWNDSRRGFYIFCYVIDTYLSEMNIHELYDFFAKNRQGTIFLRKYALSSPMRVSGGPLQFLHDTLYEYGQADENYYNEVLERIAAEKTEKEKSKGNGKK